MKTLMLAANWGAYFYSWAQSEQLHIMPPQAIEMPGLLERFYKVILINGIGDQWLFHPCWQQHPRSYFFLWDPARCPHYAPTPERLEQLKQLHKCYSFQEQDCVDFGLAFNSTMYAPPPPALLPERPELCFDVLFLGVPKDRLAQLRHLHAQLSRFDLKLHFRIGITTDQQLMPEQAPGWLMTREWLCYPDYLQLVAQSRCLLDLYQRIQTGFSLRVMEHIFFGKKLITNNPTIKQAKFYHPNNVFLLRQDDFSGIKDWLDLPFVPIDESIKKYYNIMQWVERFN